MAVTGILFGLTFLPDFLWMAAIGGAISIALGKALFGGLVQPFLTRRWWRAFLRRLSGSDDDLEQPLVPIASRGVSRPPGTAFSNAGCGCRPSATPLAMKFERQSTAPMTSPWIVGGSTEKRVLFSSCWGSVLAARNMLNWRIPASILLYRGRSAVSSTCCTRIPIRRRVHALLRRAFFGAMFMATTW
jgi:electron transport complex protein RnfD